MSFLVWDNLGGATANAATISAGYGCPYKLSRNDYVMTRWATVTKSDAEEKWGFSSPQDRPGFLEQGVSGDVLIDGLTGSPQILDNRPEDWFPPDPNSSE